MTETKPDYDTKLAALESENATLKAQNTQLQAQLSSAFSLINAYEAGADLVRATAKVFPRRIQQGASDAQQ